MATATLMDLAEVRTHIETGLVDAALQTLMDAAQEAIDQRHGELDAETDDLVGGLKSIWTTRPIGTITTVTETAGSDDTVLDASDYIKRHNTQLDRLDTGPNSRQRWGDRVKIVYAPRSDEEKRNIVFIALIKLAVEYSGLDNSKDGDFSSKTLNYADERERLLSTLDEKGFFV